VKVHLPVIVFAVLFGLSMDYEVLPAFMKVAGKADSWLPGFLDRHLPRVQLD
jgi:uncharacterized membrane protein YdfJ with MMPL/SSD domain